MTVTSSPDATRRLGRIERNVALSLISGAAVGRLAWCVNGWPHVEVVNFAMDGDAPVFRIGTSTKLIGLLNGAPFALQVDHIDPVTRTGWTVTVAGPVRRMTAEEAERLAAAPQPWAPGNRPWLIRMTPRRVVGRVLAEHREPHGSLRAGAPRAGSATG